MNSKQLFLQFVVVFTAPLSVFAADWAQWRGPARTGVSAEKGLVDQWPQTGPKLAWRSTEVKNGYGSPSIAAGRIYVVGNQGVDDEYVLALDAKTGQKIWETRIGKVGNPDQAPPYPAARSTPTIDGDRIFALSSDGDMACLDLNGKVLWKKNVRTEFGGKPGVWAYSESPLVDGNTVVCTPGGADATILALNKMTGDVLWKCALPEGDDAGYSSAIAVNTGGKKQYLHFLSLGLVGVDAESGKFLWRALETKNEGANMVTPIEYGGFVYVPPSGFGGLAELMPTGDGVTAKQVYRKRGLPNAIGGAVLVDGYLYGTTQEGLVCADFRTGEEKWKAPSIGVGSIIAADGLLFIHGENSDVALVEASPKEYREKGRFTLSDQPERVNKMEKAWAYPAVANGRLYIRDKNVLWSFEVSDAASPN